MPQKSRVKRHKRRKSAIRGPTVVVSHCLPCPMARRHRSTLDTSFYGADVSFLVLLRKRPLLSHKGPAMGSLGLAFPRLGSTTVPAALGPRGSLTLGGQAADRRPPPAAPTPGLPVGPLSRLDAPSHCRTPHPPAASRSSGVLGAPTQGV